METDASMKHGPTRFTSTSIYQIRGVAKESGSRRAVGAVQKAYRSPLTYVIVGLIGLFAHILWSEELYTFFHRFLAWVLLVLFLSIAYKFVNTAKKEVPIIPLVFFHFYMLYGFAQFTQSEISLFIGVYTPREDTLNTAMLLVVGAELAFLVGTWAGKSTGWKSKLSIWKKLPLPTQRWMTGVILYGIGSLLVMVFVLSNIPIEIRRIVAVFFNPHLGLILLLFLAFRTGSRVLLAVALISSGGLIAYGLSIGMLEWIIVTIYIWSVASWIWGSRFRLRWLVLALLIFFILNPAKYLYRSGEALGGSVLEQWGNAIALTWFGESKKAAIERGLARTSNLIHFSQCIEWVPEIVPFNKGEGFEKVFMYYIPRFFWRDKPGISELINNKWAIAFYVSTPEGVEKSTFGISQPLDGFWDFGILGSMLYPFGFGFLLGLLFLGPGRANDSVKLMGLLLTSEFFQILGPLQNFFVSLLSLSVGAWVVFLVMRLLFRSSRGYNWATFFYRKGA